MEELNKKLYRLFLSELEKLQIGYSYDKKTLCQMIDIINAIDLLKTQPSREFSIQIVKLYE